METKESCIKLQTVYVPVGINDCRKDGEYLIAAGKASIKDDEATLSYGHSKLRKRNAYVLDENDMGDTLGDFADWISKSLLTVKQLYEDKNLDAEKIMERRKNEDRWYCRDLNKWIKTSRELSVVFINRDSKVYISRKLKAFNKH